MFAKKKQYQHVKGCIKKVNTNLKWNYYKCLIKFLICNIVHMLFLYLNYTYYLFYMCVKEMSLKV